MDTCIREGRRGTLPVPLTAKVPGGLYDVSRVITVFDKCLSVAQYPNFVDHRKADRLRNGNLLLFSSCVLHEKRRDAIRLDIAHQVYGINIHRIIVVNYDVNASSTTVRSHLVFHSRIIRLAFYREI